MWKKMTSIRGGMLAVDGENMDIVDFGDKYLGPVIDKSDRTAINSR